MKCCVSTDVGTWTNWLTFEPDLDYSPDAGTGLLTPISYALQRGIVLRWENPTCRYWEPVAAVLKWFYSPRAVGTTLSEVHALHRVPFIYSLMYSNPVMSCRLIRVIFFAILSSVIDSAKGGHVIGAACHSVCLSFCQQDYWKSNEPILLKLDVMVGPTSRKNWLTFGGDPVSDTDFASLFHFPHHYEIGDFRRFSRISHTVTGRFSRYLAKWLTPTTKWIHYMLGAIWQTSGSGYGLIRKFTLDPDHSCLRFWPWQRTLRSLSTVWLLLQLLLLTAEVANLFCIHTRWCRPTHMPL